MQATGTNPPNKHHNNQHHTNTCVCVPRPLIQYLTHHNTPNTSTHVSTLILCRWSTAAGKRPDPFRTRKLSPPTPMVLHPEECGRVGNRRPTTTQIQSTREPDTTRQTRGCFRHATTQLFSPSHHLLIRHKRIPPRPRILKNNLIPNTLLIGQLNQPPQHPRIAALQRREERRY